MAELENHMVCGIGSVSYTHLRAHETTGYRVCRLLLQPLREEILEAQHLKE